LRLLNIGIGIEPEIVAFGEIEPFRLRADDAALLGVFRERRAAHQSLVSLS
jgi:hypothetical protein